MRSLLSAFLFLVPSALAADAGSFEVVVQDSLVSAMMMFLGNTDKVYIIDKAQGNQASVSGHPAWGSVWDMNTNQVNVMDIRTNTFCSSGYHLPNGSFTTFGGNGAVSIGGGAGSEADWDTVLQDFGGSRAIRILNPCKTSDNFADTSCQWYEDDSLVMQSQRWYSTAEALADGTIVLIGGFSGGGYICRNYPNDNPTAGCTLTYEFFPSNGQTPQNLSFLFKTSGLNAYPHTFLLASGKMFMQANVSTMIWDYTNNVEQPLPDMLNNVVRVYPGSGATAMLPMTPANNYSQTIIFCGGQDMADEEWGDFAYPFINTFDRPASKDCQRITPEPADGSDAKYVQDDDMLEGRTMGQFIILPTGKLLVVNGGLNGTAGYGRNNSLTPEDQMPWGQSFASGPVGTPALYDPDAPAGQRWSREGFATSNIARLYHSSAILLPDASVLIGGSNPNLDVNTTVVPFPTTYKLEKFYPSYFSASTRPVPSGVPSTLSYGGNPFDITIPASSYSGSSNTAAAATSVNVVRGGWTTHGMNMGQRFLTLNNTYTVNKDGSIILHVAQMPPNPHIFQPGPALVFVVIDGIPSNGTYVIIGSGNIEAQPTADASVLPASVLQADASGSASGSSTSSGSGNATTQSSATSHIGLIAGIAGGVGAVALVALGVGICLSRRRRARIRASIEAGKAAQARAVPTSPYQQKPMATNPNESQVFLNQRPSGQWSQNDSQVWNPNASTQSFDPYRDNAGDMTPVSAHPPAHYYNDSGDSYYDKSGPGHYNDHTGAGGYQDHTQQPRY